MKKVIVDYTKSYDRGLVGWLNRIPSDKQYVDIVMIDAGKRCGKESKIVPAQRGRGFLITDETDPLFLEFINKFPNTNYTIVE